MAELVTLADGAQVLIRPVTGADKPLFVEGFARLSDESRYRRFLGPKPRLTARDLATFTEVDHRDHEALGALDPATGRGVGVARWIRVAPGEDEAEAAVAVVDAWQGRGVGTALLARLARRAADEGVTHFCATLFTTNRAVLALFEHAGEVRVVRREGGLLAIDVALPLDERRLREALRVAAAG